MGNKNEAKTEFDQAKQINKTTDSGLVNKLSGGHPSAAQTQVSGKLQQKGDKSEGLISETCQSELFLHCGGLQLESMTKRVNQGPGRSRATG